MPFPEESGGVEVTSVRTWRSESDQLPKAKELAEELKSTYVDFQFPKMEAKKPGEAFSNETSSTSNTNAARYPLNLERREIGILLPNNQRQHRTSHAPKDVLPLRICASYCAPCQQLLREFSGWIRSPPPTQVCESGGVSESGGRKWRRDQFPKREAKKPGEAFSNETRERVLY